MADYRELLRRAISALPENNGAARRAVYEKARTALVGQLRAIQPPLPARDITQHRLQLEDCIRQVEQEASEAVISLGRDAQAATPRAAAPIATPRPIERTASRDTAPAQEARPEVDTAPAVVVLSEPVQPPPAPPVEEEVAEPVAAPGPSIEDIISEANETRADDPPAVPDEPAEIAPPDPFPDLAEPAPAKPSFFKPRREATVPFAVSAAPVLASPSLEPSLGSTALARQPASEPVIISPPLPTEPALSSIREVDLEQDGAREAEGAIERAIETLDREARGEATEPLPEPAEAEPSLPEPGSVDDNAFAAANAETRSGAGLTIFLVVFALLLVGVGGAGFWAWREGYVDLDQMFGSNTPQVTEQAQSTESILPTMDTPATDIASGEDGTPGPGNTATTQATEPTSAMEGLEPEERLEPTPDPVTPTGTETVLPSLANTETKTEERLSGADTTIATTAADDPAASVDPVNLAGNQSLLLEASTDGQSGAVPFSGTVEWTEGTDEIGAPTLIGRASIPARNLGVSITIRKNNDPILPASHLMEISFDVPDTFVGGTVSTLAGVLLKDEELVPGNALAGAAARVVGNSFLFALSASPDDVTANIDLLDTRRWLDLAIVYGTGRNAILTLEKDEEAQVLFDRVLAAWTS